MTDLRLGHDERPGNAARVRCGSALATCHRPRTRRRAALLVAALVNGYAGTAWAVDPHLTTAKEAVPLTQCQAEIRLHVTGAGDPQTQRLPLDVMIVFDRSGSMGGAPLASAKAAAKALVDELDPSLDQAALTSYSTTASLDQGLTFNHALVKTKIDALTASGFTNIGDGVFDGQAELAANGRAAPTVRAMVVLSIAARHVPRIPLPTLPARWTPSTKPLPRRRPGPWYTPSA